MISKQLQHNNTVKQRYIYEY